MRRSSVLLIVLMLAFVPAAAREHLTVVTLNLWHDQHDWPARLPLILTGLRSVDADVILLQEVLQHSELSNQARTLADSLGCTMAFFSVDPPDGAKRYGNAVLTRLPVLATHQEKLEPLDDWRVAGHVRLDWRGRPLDVVVTHLHHTFEGGDIRAEQVRHLLRFVDRVAGDGLLVVGGDFNAPPDAPELAPLRARLTDAFAAVHPELVGVLVSTLSTELGHTPRRIDHLYASPQLEPAASEVFLDRPTDDGIRVSDHFGVWARWRPAPPAGR